MTNSKLNKNKVFHFYLLILLSAYLLTNGCALEREIVNTDELVKISQPKVFGRTFKNGLYKTDMQLYDHELSGLMFFNKKENSMRVVMLSEVGLKYFDVEFILGEQNPFLVHQLTDFLNHDKVINSIENFLSLLMIDINDQHQTYKSENQTGFLLREIKNERGKKIYHYNSNSGSIDGITRSGKNKSTTTLTAYDYLSPGKIVYKQGKIHFTLNKVKKD